MQVSMQAKERKTARKANCKKSSNNRKTTNRPARAKQHAAEKQKRKRYVSGRGKSKITQHKRQR